MTVANINWKIPQKYEVILDLQRPIYKLTDDGGARRRRDAKVKAFEHYCNGEPCCVHCGNTDLRVLCLHHIDGGGNEHRKQYGNNFYNGLERDGYPEGLIALCANCHLIIHSTQEY